MARSQRAAAEAAQPTFADWLEGLTERARVRDAATQASGLFLVVLGLMSIGLLVQMSFNASVLEPDEFRAALGEHLLFRVCGLAALMLGYVLGPRGLRPFVPALTVLAGILLVLCFAPVVGVNKNGSSRWVDLGIMFQPSEIARIVVVLWIADRCVRLGPRVYEIKEGLAPMLAVALVFFGLVLVETDLGGSMLLLLCALSTMWVGGARPLPMTLSLVAIGGGTITLMTAAIPYVRQRVAMFFGAVQNDQVQGTFEALTWGGFEGVGYAHGPARLMHVPYLESDYVFAQIGEELGLFGLLLVLGLLAAFLWFALRLVLSIADRYSALCAFGLLVSVGLQAMLHVQVVAGLAPPKGMTLPFISDGGTSLVVSSFAVGLALGVARRRTTEEPLA